MALARTLPTASRMTLDAGTAADLMSTQVISVRADASVMEALALFSERGLHAAPVIEESGRPLGVLSRSDLLIHDRERAAAAGTATPVNRDQARVRDIMTPAVFSVTPDAEAAQVVEQMLAFNVHQLYVVDDAQVLVGVITVHDVLRRLRSQ